MVTLDDIDKALARAEELLPAGGWTPEQEEQATCLSNARAMLRDLGLEATAALERMSDTLERLGDVAERG